MCRGFQQQNYRDRLLKIKAFYLRLSLPNSINILPDSLTLHYLPRINASPLEIDELSIRPDSPAFVTLHRVVNAGGEDNKGIKGSSSVLYCSRERVGVSEGVKFEVYLGEDKLVRGFFRKDDQEWKLELKCGLIDSGSVGVMVDIKEVDVCVAAEGGIEMSKKVEMVVRKKKRGRCYNQGLEEIPEEREGELVEEEGVDGCCCCDECRSSGDEVDEVSGGGGGGDVKVEVEMEGVRWALDVGIWVTCLGVGCLLSIASSKARRRRTRFL